MSTCLVHLASGIGNVVFATPLLRALDELGYAVELCLDADYAQTADLLQPWSVLRAVHVGNIAALVRRPFDAVVPAVPPFYWRRFAAVYRSVARAVARPGDELFAADEQAYYMGFARALGFRGARPSCYLPIAPPDGEPTIDPDTLVLAPGCKTGTMAAKRWPWFPELAARFQRVAVVGTSDDLKRYDGCPMVFPPHARSFVDRLSLRQTAELLASARAVVANDSGLAHVAAAVGTPTLMLFGPTSHTCLGELPPSATIMRANLPCEPCWTTAPLAACARRVDCLRRLDVDTVAREARALLGAPVSEPCAP